MKVHITLVGGQAAPVYSGIIATNPDRVVFIYSNRTKKYVELVKNEISVISDDQPPLDEVNPYEIIERANSLAEKYKDDDVTLNISSGLKSWSHLFGKVFDAMSNATIIYLDQNNNLWNYKTLKSSPVKQIEIFTLFRLYDNPLTKYRRFDEYTKNDEQVISDIEKIRKVNYEEFNSLTAVLDSKKSRALKNNDYGTFESSNPRSNSYAEWIKTTPEELGFVRLFIKGRGSDEKKLESEHVIELVFNSGWFEYKIAKMLSSWRQVNGIYLNCVFPLKPEKAKNEVDIIVDAGGKILFVECKTQITKVTDVDKFKTVKDTYGGTGSKGLFVTDAVMDPEIKKKCDDLRILTFSLQENHRGLSKVQALIALLESNFMDINER